MRTPEVEGVLASMTGTISQQDFALFVSSIEPDWGEQAFETAALAICDTLAVAFAARGSSVVRKTAAWARGRSSIDTSAPFWLGPDRTDPEIAAFVNAVAAHALDYDDVAPAWRGHPSSVLVAALSALAAHPAATDRSMLDAYTVGFETGAALGAAVIETHYPAGWHSTATVGVLAATAACCRLLAKPPAIVANALGLAVAQAAGTQAHFGTEAKSLQAGFAAAAAVRSTLLAEIGVEAGREALHGPCGFFDLYGPGRVTASTHAVRALGTRPPALVGGIEPKLFPTCYATHRALLVASELRDTPGFSHERIESLFVSGSRGSHDPLISRPPTNPDEAKFHIQTILALLLVEGRVGLESFDTRRFEETSIRRLAARIEVGEDPAPTSVRWSRLTAVVGGREWVGEASRLPVVSWHTEAWCAKVRDCMGRATRVERSRFVEAVSRIVGAGYAERVETALAAGDPHRTRGTF